HEDVVARPAVGDDGVGLAAGEAVAEVVGRPAAHREGVGAASVPVADVDAVVVAAVDEGQVGDPRPAVGHVVAVALALDLGALAGGGCGRREQGQREASSDCGAASCRHVVPPGGSSSAVYGTAVTGA